MENELKLFMILLGSKAPGRTVEQHDFFFGIATSLKELVPAMRDFWPEAGSSLHIDGWREVTGVDGYKISIAAKGTHLEFTKKLFFVNLGGYREGILEEQHYTLLTIRDDRKEAMKTATVTSFFKQQSIQTIKAASAHIDEKYGIDVDEIYRIEDVLSPALKAAYTLVITKQEGPATVDQVHLGYLKLNQL
ncbi:DUF1543 domain-containing protein [Mucilaginibacter endophyticus]|uniref:DUF1543 domain-containing protein n=1 Tax=Mucilaginibacter endophyticus TaxID=2675003 RepID=UPI000E0DCD82|nr:DUF1543 domain-containing protein [Mucilaginibacter endophyticus]